MNWLNKLANTMYRNQNFSCFFLSFIIILILFFLTRFFRQTSNQRCILHSKKTIILVHCKSQSITPLLTLIWLDILAISIHLSLKNFSWLYSVKWDHVKIVKLSMRYAWHCLFHTTMGKCLFVAYWWSVCIYWIYWTSSSSKCITSNE